MAEVFVCHATPDRAVAEAACRALEAEGVSCWMAARDAQPGVSWASQIVRAINEAKVQLLIFSRHANASPHVAREVERASSRGIPIVPYRTEDALPGEQLEYFVSDVHWLDAFPNPLAPRPLARLAEEVRALMGRAPAVIRPTAPSPRPGRSRLGRRGLLIGAAVLALGLAAGAGLLLRAPPPAAPVQVGKAAASGEAAITAATRARLAPGVAQAVQRAESAQAVAEAAAGRARQAAQQSRAFAASAKRDTRTGADPDGDTWTITGRIAGAAGEGVIVWSTGTDYAGPFVDDHPDGAGVYRWTSGAIYEGELKADDRHGYGIYRFANGSVYRGQYATSQRCGYGVHLAADGKAYKGQWLDGQRHGYGAKFRSDGALIEQGLYRADKLVRPVAR